MKKYALEAKFIPCKPGTLLHNWTMKSNQSFSSKFLIKQVLDMWDGFDSDLHSPGSYIIWNWDQSVEKIDVEKKRKKEKKNEKPGEQYGESEED